MKKQTLLCVTMFFVLVLSSTAQNSYQSTAQMNKYTKGILAFENGNYTLAKQYFDKINVLDNQEYIAVEKYRLLTSLELKENSAGVKTEMYLKENPNTIERTTLVLALSNYYFSKRKDEKALEWFHKIDVKNLTEKQEENYNYKLAFSNYKVQNYTKAKQYLLPISKQGEYQEEAHYYLGSIAVENKNYSSARFHLDKIKSVRKYSKEANYQLLVVLYEEQNYKQAVELGTSYYNSIVGVQQSEVSKIIGESYFYLEDYKNAINYLSKYKGKRKKLTVVDYYFLGYAYYKEGEYNNAIENFNKITDERSLVAQNSHYHLGDCYLRKNQKTEALNAFKNASEMDFDVSVQQDAFLNYAKLSYDIGNPYQSSSEVLQSFVDTYPNAKETTLIEGLIINAYLQSNDFIGAITYYDTQRLTKDTQYQELLLLYGLELFVNGDYKKALPYFSKVSEIYNNRILTEKGLFWKAETLSEMNDNNGAIYSYKAFVGNNKNKELEEYSDGVYGLAYVLFQQKKYTSALSYFKEYLQIAMNSEKKENAILRVADCHFASKTYWSALENYNLIIKGNKSQMDYAMYQKALCYGFLSKLTQKKEVLIEIQTRFSHSAYLDNSYYELGNLLISQTKNSEAIKVFDQLITKLPKSPLVVKAKLKKGITLFNLGANQASIKVLKDLVASYPGTGEAVQAVKMAEQVYKEIDKVELYATWVKKLEFINITDQDIDKSMFEAAENKYLENNLKSAITSCKKYLINFPQGLHTLTVHFYLAQAYYNSGDRERSIPEYKEVLSVNSNEYTEVSLNRLSQIYLKNEQWALASTLLLRIEKDATNTQNVVYAQSNLMKFYYKEKRFTNALDYTNKVLKNIKSSEQAIADAYVYGARSAIELDDFKKATSYYQKLESVGKGIIKAEANYYKAFFLHQDKGYQASNKQIQVLASKYQSYRFWSVKGLLLMAQNFHYLKDDFQANFILKNVISNVKEYPELVEEAEELLEEYKPEESTEVKTQKKENINVTNEF